MWQAGYCLHLLYRDYIYFPEVSPGVTISTTRIMKFCLCIFNKLECSYSVSSSIHPHVFTHIHCWGLGRGLLFCVYKIMAASCLLPCCFATAFTFVFNVVILCPKPEMVFPQCFLNTFGQDRIVILTKTLFNSRFKLSYWVWSIEAHRLEISGFIGSYILQMKQRPDWFSHYCVQIQKQSFQYDWLCRAKWIPTLWDVWWESSSNN